MLTRAYDGASSLVDAAGRSVVECRDPEIAAWIESVVTTAATVAAGLEAQNEMSTIRAEIRLADLFRYTPEGLK